MNKWNLINADSGEKTWLTPKHIIDALGDFDTDPKENAFKCKLRILKREVTDWEVVE